MKNIFDTIILFIKSVSYFIKEVIALFKGKEKELFTTIEESIDDIFDGFIGNGAAVKRIKRLIRYAKLKNLETIPSIGLFGPRSTGKTELFRRISNALQVPTLILSKSTLNSEETFFKEVTKEIEDVSGGLIAPPMIIFIDEAHLLSQRILDGLLTALEPTDKCFRSKHGDIDTSNITFIIATTEPQKLGEAFRSRLLVLNLETYTLNEIVKILAYNVDNNLDLDEACTSLSKEELRAIAIMSRNIPRVAIELLKQVSAAIALGDIEPTKDEVINDLKSMLDCDNLGFTKNDRKYMNILYNNKAVGVASLAAMLDVEKENVEKIIEPFLLQKELILKTKSGRQLTPKGRQFVEDIFPNQERI